MIWYILQKFESRDKEKINILTEYGLKYLAKQIIPFIIIYSFYAYEFLKSNLLLSAVGYIILMAYSFHFIKKTAALTDRQIDSGLQGYKRRLDILRDTLKEMELYSSERVEYILELVQEQKTKWLHSKNFLKPFTIIMSTTILPMILIALKSIFEHINTVNEIVFYLGLIVSLILLFISIIYMIHPFLTDFFDKEYFSFDRLQSMLHDIYLIDFVEQKGMGGQT